MDAPVILQRIESAQHLINGEIQGLKSSQADIGRQITEFKSEMNDIRRDVAELRATVLATSATNASSLVILVLVVQLLLDKSS